MSRGALARAAALDQSTVYRLEVDERQQPEMSTIMALAAALHVSTDDLLGISTREVENGAVIRIPIVAIIGGDYRDTEEWIVLPDAFGECDMLRAARAKAVRVTAAMADGDWREGDVALFVANATPEDRQYILMLAGGEVVLRRYRRTTAGVFALGADNDLVPLSLREIVGVVVGGITLRGSP